MNSVEEVWCSGMKIWRQCVSCCWSGPPEIFCCLFRPLWSILPRFFFLKYELWTQQFAESKSLSIFVFVFLPKLENYLFLRRIYLFCLNSQFPQSVRVKRTSQIPCLTTKGVQHCQAIMSAGNCWRIIVFETFLLKLSIKCFALQLLNRWVTVRLCSSTVLLARSFVRSFLCCRLLVSYLFVCFLLPHLIHYLYSVWLVCLYRHTHTHTHTHTWRSIYINI